MTIIKSRSHVQGEVLVTAPLQFDINNGKLNFVVEMNFKDFCSA